VSRPKKAILFTLLGAVALVGVLFSTAVILLQTDWFKNKVRERIVSVAETATGGRVEIGKFNYNWHNLTAEVALFTLHGKEPREAPPFFRANRIQIGLKIISAVKKQVDISSLVIEKPQTYVTVAPDGSTNVPVPKAPLSKKNLAEQLLDLKVAHFELRDGIVEFNSEKIPLNVKCDQLRVTAAYEAGTPQYTGEVSARYIHLTSPRIKAPVDFDFNSKLALRQTEIQVLQAQMSAGKSKLEAVGAIRNLSSPHADFVLTATGSVKDLNRAFALPIQSLGSVAFEGRGSVQSSPFQYKLEGKVTGRELAYNRNELAVKNIALSSRVEMTPEKISLPDLQLAALHGQFRGSAQLLNFQRLSVNGIVSNFELKEIATLGQRETGELNGILSGPVRFEGRLAGSGLQDITADGQFTIISGTGGVPLHGAINVNYSQRAGTIQLGSSELNLGSTHIGVSGTIGERLQVQVVSRNLNDALPLFPLLGESAPEQLPIALHGGTASFEGTVTGPFASPRISGKADLTHFALDQREFDRVTATFDADASAVNLHTLNIEQGKMRIEGQGRASLHDWKVEDASAISALLNVQGVDIQKILADNEDWSKIPITGIFSASAHVTGTLDSPLATGNIDLQNVDAYDEHFDRIRADVTLTATSLEVTNGDIRSGTARCTVSGAYNHPANDWKDGSVRFDASSNRFNLTQIKHVRDFRPGLGGELEVKAAGTAKIVKGEPSLTSLNGQIALRNAVVDERNYGNVELTAATRLPVLTLGAKVDLNGIQLRGGGEWRMEGDYPGEARVQIPQVTFATLHELWPGAHLREELPFGGFLQGEAVIAGSLNKLADLKATVTLSTVQLNAGPNVHPVAGTQAQDLVLKNAQPVVLEGTIKSINVRSAEFTAKDTTLSMTGRLALDSKNPWDLTVKGRIHLSILQIFNPDLLAAGTSVVNMVVRGSLTEPQVDGRLELQNASVYIRDLPNGMDQANGVILFDRNRATIQTLSAVSGGGQVTFESGSFVGFRGAALVYRLQATARQVRYRSSDGVSLTADANLSLLGTSEKSVLSGTVTVVRAGFNPRTDVGALLASTAKPVSVPTTPNEYLRGIQFDVNVLSSRNLEIQTSLTRNIQADANLHLRGTPERPVVLGNLTVSSGQIEFFGNKYTISRGEINFYNPARIDPIIDMDLDTQVRGVVVDISFSGPLNKLNFSYRSDPPLQTNEIIALLAVGRTPTTVGGLASSQTTGNTGYLSTGSNALLGQAIAPASGRLQRLFGVGHIKIDPQLNDITSVPQARLTLEQQVSTDITFTYITNLARTDEQIVRLQWDFSRKWSVVALRDENGAFSIDFQYRKRFK